MTAKEPTAEAMSQGKDATLLPWAEARERLAGGGTYWLATVRPDGRPHVVPLGPAWLDDVLYFTTGQGTRKEANLAHNPHCVITITTPDSDMILEGTAAHMRDEATLQRLAEVYRAQGWPVSGVRDGALDAPFSAPTTGPAPYEVYEVTPTRAFALGTTEATVERCTRYRF